MSKNRLAVVPAVALLALAVLALPAARAEADAAAEAPQPTQADEGDLDRLERAFWACDYVATTEGVQATPAATCRYVTEELKRRKFAGSFGRMLEWWTTNKPAEHRRLARMAEQ